jgi:nucleotide-binding universal stress UspA family protein
MAQVQTHPQSGIAHSLVQGQTILFPTDFSEISHNAFEYCLHLAEALSARILLLHASFETPFPSGWVPEEFVQALREEKTDKAMKFFHEYQREAQLVLGKSVEVIPMIVRGTAADEIVRISQRDDVGLIVMGTMGAESLSEKILGSVTAKVIESAQCPVLAVPAEARYTPIRHILYGTRFEKEDMAVIRQLLEFADLFPAHLSCTHIRSQQGYWDQVDVKVFEELYQLELKDERLRFFISNDPDVMHGLNRFVQDHKVDMIVMLKHRQHYLDRMLSESQTRQMALHTEVPLLALHDH